MRISEKTTENSEWLGRQARLGFEPGTSCFPVLSATTSPLVGQHWIGPEDNNYWGQPRPATGCSAVEEEEEIIIRL